MIQVVRNHEVCWFSFTCSRVRKSWERWFSEIWASYKSCAVKLFTLWPSLPLRLETDWQTLRRIVGVISKDCSGWNETLSYTTGVYASTTLLRRPCSSRRVVTALTGNRHSFASFSGRAGTILPISASQKIPNFGWSALSCMGVSFGAFQRALIACASTESVYPLQMIFH